MDRPFHYYASGHYYNYHMEQEADHFIRLAVDFDELWGRASKILDEVKDTLLSFKDTVNNTARLNTINLPIHTMPWLSDVQIDV